MYAPQERLGVPLKEPVNEQPDSQDPEGEADGGGQRQGVHGEQAEASVGQRSAPAGRLFAVELVALQLVWLALLGLTAWLLLS
jgi:hypothetical protein